MKTKKFFLVLILCVLSIGTSWAQLDYYRATGIIQRGGYSYQCDNETGGGPTLYNSNNREAYFEGWGRKDGGPLGDDFFMKYDVLPNERAGRLRAQEVAAQVFTEAELQVLRQSKRLLLITLIINSDTGRVDEVNFQFPLFTGYAQVPIEKYRQIELAIKENVTFQVSPEGRLLNYCMTFFSFQPIKLTPM